ncbi:uncharacterized protein MELLADRAFT_89709 [Melampsora larici-populina 98AG31]|uniref:Acyltransferase 3 domain-containing protein n=1 Tax=Melampsora larici-populina (strain 98AG31 / pathotype 3-4-7) TaxID=747676 RepID=F4RUC3_MELLP|nr:uncharacterized protein MELLADRAFT_89709 [Melampsora larici-populina 98AG31]EGG04024.1 hypothetical protein MELLADRAFT_89709 [Melampsora larici-populina 98AG31]
MFNRDHIDKALARMNLFGFKTKSGGEYEILALEDHLLEERRHQPEEEQDQATNSSKGVTQHWANGLRGLAAFCVMIHHGIVAFNSEAVLDTNDPDGTVHFWQWPILRSFISPSFLVTLFFVLSGYVLSYRPLHRISTNPSDSISVRNSLASACLRRIVRLAPPPLFSLIVSHTILLSGGFDQTRAAKVGTWWTIDHIPRFVTPNWHAQTVECLKFMVNLWYDAGNKTQYNVVLWTMREEFLGSLNVFLVLLAISNLQLRFRVMLVIALGLVNLCHNEVAFLPFLLGILIAELQVSQSQPTQPTFNRRNILCGYLRSSAMGATLIVGLFFGSVPWLEMTGASWSRWMFQVMSRYSEDEFEVKQAYNIMGGCLTVLTISRWPAAQQFFSTRPLQFLGRISFSLYVIHAPLLLSVGVSLAWRFQTWGISDTLSTFLMVPFWVGCVIAFSWLMTKYLDEKAITFSHALERALGAKNTSDGSRHPETSLLSTSTTDR